MAKKKQKQARPAPNDFSNNPFDNLKGLSVFNGQNSGADGAKTGQSSREPIPTDGPEEGNSFAEEMAFLGVKPLEDNGRSRAGDLAADNDTPAAAAATDGHDNDAAAFLDAVGNMETVFKDEWCEVLPDKRAVPRRMRQVERGQLVPEGELDLHGLSVDEARNKALFFLQNAVFQGFRTVLLITGKGLHSENGPVLRSAMERLLSESPEQVIEWGVAPRRYGGEGALVVFLRQPGLQDP